MSLFDPPIRSVKTRKGEHASIYLNGCINISGIQYHGYSLTEAKRVHARKYPRKTTNK
jgi:hypothetical protein